MSIQDLVRRIDQAKANLNEATVQVRNQQISEVRTSDETKGKNIDGGAIGGAIGAGIGAKSGLEAERLGAIGAEIGAKSGSEAERPLNTGKSDVCGPSQAERELGAVTGSLILGSALGPALAPTGAFIGWHNPDVIPEMTVGVISGAAGGAIAGIPGGPPGIAYGAIGAAVGGGLAALGFDLLEGEECSS